MAILILLKKLYGNFVEAIHLKAKVKEVSTPKFYFFDCGVVRALRNELGEKISESERGYLLETFILNEVQVLQQLPSKIRRNLLLGNTITKRS